MIPDSCTPRSHRPFAATLFALAVLDSGFVAVDSMAGRVLAMGLDVIVTYQKASNAPARRGLQLVAVDVEVRPRIADMIQLPGLIGVPAADPPYIYVPAEEAGLVVLLVG